MPSDGEPMPIKPRNATPAKEDVPAPSPVNPAADGFIDAAPDGRSSWRKRKVPISVSIPAPMLDALERHAVALGQSRAFVVNVAIIEYLKREGAAPPGV